MVKSGKSFVKIGSCLQIALFFLFYRNFQHLAYSSLPNVPNPPFHCRLLGQLPPPSRFIRDQRVLNSISILVTIH